MISKSKSNTEINIIVEIAFIEGFIPFLDIEYIVIDKLLTPFPVVKYEITKSSIDIVNDIKAPVKIPLVICGIITFLIA